MIVCICHSISECQIKKSLSKDCKNFKDIQSKLKVATNCSKCQFECKKIIVAHQIQGYKKSIIKNQEEEAIREVSPIH